MPPAARAFPSLPLPLPLLLSLLLLSPVLLPLLTAPRACVRAQAPEPPLDVERGESAVVAVPSVQFGGAFEAVVNAVSEPTRVLLEWVSTPPTPEDRAARGLPDVLLLGAAGQAPPGPNRDGDGCSVFAPCLDEGATDVEGFLGESARAALVVDVPADEQVFVRVASYARGRVGEDGEELRPQLSGNLVVRREEEGAVVCGGGEEGNGECRGRGRCAEVGECECENGWGGRFCEVQIDEAPTVEQRPTNEASDVAALMGSALVSVEKGEGRYFAVRVGEGQSRVAFRARVLAGVARLENGTSVAVGGTEGVATGMYVGEEGQVPVRGVSGEQAQVFVNRRGDARGGDLYELVVVTEETTSAGTWVVWLLGNDSALTGDGDQAVYSLRVRRCGGNGGDGEVEEEECPFVGRQAGGSFPTGVVIAVCAVAAVLTVVVVVLWLVRKRVRAKWGSVAGSQAGAAWEQVDVRGGGRASGANDERRKSSAANLAAYKLIKAEKRARRQAEEERARVKEGEGAREEEDKGATEEATREEERTKVATEEEEEATDETTEQRVENAKRSEAGAGRATQGG